MRLYIQAVALRSMNLLEKQLASSEQYDAALRDIQSYMGRNWGLSDDQKVRDLTNAPQAHA